MQHVSAHGCLPVMSAYAKSTAICTCQEGLIVQNVAGVKAKVGRLQAQDHLHLVQLLQLCTQGAP